MTFDPMGEALDADEVQETVDETIENNEVVLFMKGTPVMPQCGYSKRAVGLIGQYRDDFEAVDALQNLEAFREALDEHSGWETIPQTYVEGEFVGGSDILAQLDEEGDLAETLKAADADADADVETAADGGSDEDLDAPF
ncbi:glutaredoxin-related protein [Halarchaeum acidiphilum MH1-52-1]|uniref:Glutaredoxin-related protein n=1 Tax=Halarchaeum acidiphilum MH1-52-1 TaxID=1261545 RepID=U2YUK6_9EURY|nr:glutaredoxin family protein [Halarchaeum acidiphilum]GAD52432.1 glutaredoxin-related protein [Halarchaeum acidiphilum MH1-52-1]